MLDFFGLLYFSQPTNGMVGDQVGAAANLAPIPSLNIIQFPFHIPVGVHSKGIGLPVFKFNLLLLLLLFLFTRGKGKHGNERDSKREYKLHADTS